MPFEIETGQINFMIAGKNALIKRKNKIIPITSSSAKNKLIEGDTLITGKKTKIHLSINYDRGKDISNKDYKDRISKSIFMGPNSELQLTGFDKWDIIDKKTNERKYGELIKNIYLKKGFFHVSYYNTEDPIETPVASIIFNGSASGFFDVYEDKLYSCPQSEKGVKYTNLKTKKSFLAKANTPEEIIITNDSIYRRGFVNMDEIFQNNVQLLISLQGALSETTPKLDTEIMSKQMKSVGNVMEQSTSGLEVLKQMNPEDIERLMKMGGQEITPEMKEKLKEIPLLMKKMEEEGITEKIKKSSAMMKGYMEGMGSENMDKYLKISEKANKQKNIEINKITKNVDKFLDNPRKYKPLTKEFGAIKVG